MEEVYPISSVLARKNSPACYHTGESFLSILTIHHPIRKIASPMLSFSPVIVMFCVAFVTGFMTQSYAASVAVLVPFLQVVLGTGADPFAAAFAAASGASLIQYFLTGGPVAALATVIPVVPGSNLKQANLFQRPSILFGCLVALIITILLMIF